MNGLLVSIIGQDCTNHGVTSGKSQAILVGGECQVFESSEDKPALAIVDHPVLGADMVDISGKVRHVHAAPIIDGKPVTGMFGGHFIITSDSRFPFPVPVKVFDRFETREQQRMNSI